MKPWMIFAGLAAAVIVAVAFFMTSDKQSASTVAAKPSEQEKKMDWPAQQAAFLAENIKKPGWAATPSGIQYTVLKAGDGTTPKPAPGSEVTVHYEGKLINGEIFDSSYARNEKISFGLNQVIPGWQQGVPMMRVGEVWEFVIPSNLAYGDRGTGPIPGGSVLIFKIELLEAKTPA